MYLEPKVSVVMSVRDSDSFLRYSIDSILNQTYQNLEFIIVNDGSKDTSEDIIKDYLLKDSRIIYAGNTGGIGLTKALIFAIKNASSEYIARQDADDISGLNRIKNQMNFLEANPDCVLVGTAISIIDSSNVVIRKPWTALKDNEIRRLLMFGNIFVHGSVIFKKKMYHLVGGYSENIKYAQDFDLWLKLSKYGLLFNIPTRDYFWRKNDVSISSNKKNSQKSYALLILLSDHLDNDLYNHYLFRLAASSDCESFSIVQDCLVRLNNKRLWLLAIKYLVRNGEYHHAKNMFHESNIRFKFFLRILFKILEIKFFRDFFFKIYKFINKHKGANEF